MMKRIAKNLFHLLTGEAFSSFLAFVTTIWLARRLTDEGFGHWAFVQSLLLYLMLIVDLGLSTYGMREIARKNNDAPDIISQILKIRFVMAILLFIICVPFFYILNINNELRLLLWGGIFIVFAQALKPEFALQGLEKMQGVAAFRIGWRILYLLPLLIWVHARSDLWMVGFFRTLSEMIAAIFIWYLLLKKIKISFSNKLVWNDVKPSLKVSLVMAASIVVIRVYYSFDTFLLGIMDQPQVVGWYNAAYKVILLFIGITVILQTGFAPSMTRLKNNIQALNDLVAQYSAVLCLSAGVVCAFLIIFSKQIILRLFGTGFSQSIPVLSLLSVSCFIIITSTTFLSPLLFTDRQVDYFKTSLAGAVVNVILNIITIPKFSYYGAVYSTIFSNAVIFVLGSYYYYKLSQSWTVIRQNSIHFIMFILIFLLFKFLSITLFLQILIFISLYAVLYFILFKRQVLNVFYGLKQL